MLRDIDLVDDIIALRKRLEEVERQRDNALDVVMRLRAGLLEIYWNVDDPKAHKMAARVLDQTEGK